MVGGTCRHFASHLQRVPRVSELTITDSMATSATTSRILRNTPKAQLHRLSGLTIGRTRVRATGACPVLYQVIHLTKEPYVACAIEDPG